MRAALALLACLSLLAISGCGQQGPKGDPGPTGPQKGAARGIVANVSCKYSALLLAAVSVLLLLRDPRKSLLCAFKPRRNLERLTEIVERLVELAKRFIGLAAPA
jgi:hypothetical protein